MSSLLNLLVYFLVGFLEHRLVMFVSITAGELETQTEMPADDSFVVLS